MHSQALYAQAAIIKIISVIDHLWYWQMIVQRTIMLYKYTELSLA